MTDYQSNSKNVTGGKTSNGEKKLNERVVTGDVIQQKKPLRKRIKDVFISGDAHSVTSYLFSDVVLPAAKNVIVDAASEGIRRLIYGDKAGPNRAGTSGGTRYSYHTPVNRGVQDPRSRGTSLTGYRAGSPTVRDAEPFVLSNREEAELVLERMQDIINVHEGVTVADLHELVGFPQTHTDQKWGWESIQGAVVRQVREGYLIDLPPAIPM